VFEQSGKRYALRWTVLDASSEAELEAFYVLNRAGDWKEFQAALSRYTGPTQNFIYADRAGNIGYYAAGRIPVRRDKGGTLPYDGTATAGDVTGFIPFAELPHSYNPPSGIIVTANNRLVGRNYKYFLGDEWASPYRARRIYDLLQATPKHTTDSFRSILGDVHSIGGALFAHEAAQLLSQATASVASEATNKTSDTVLLLKGWDGRVTSDSRVAPLVAEMRLSFRRRVLTGLLGEARAKDYRGANVENFIDRILTTRDPEFLPAGSASYTELMQAALQDARGELLKRLGADEATWTWGRYSTIRFPHPLASVPFIGGQFAIKPLPGEGAGSQPGATPNVGAGVSMRFIADTNDWDASQQGIALGISGDPTNPHWMDQLNDWRAVTPAAFPFTPEAVKQATTQTLVLKP
jgi:penicillin amidase